MRVLDGVYTFEQGRPRFHPDRAPDRDQLDRLLDRLIRRILRRLTADGLLVADPEQPWFDIQPDETMCAIEAASIRYCIAVGPEAGRRTMTIINPHLVREAASPPKAFTATRDGFSRNAAVACQPHQRQRLERLCRYVTRSAICLERLSVGADCRIRYALKKPWSNGFQGLLAYLGMQLLQIRPRLLLETIEHLRCPLKQLRLPIGNLVRMNVVLLG